jgi:hypothetical protein
MDIMRIWTMEPIRDYIKELSDSILLRLQLVVEVYRDMTRFLVKNAFFLAFFMK